MPKSGAGLQVKKVWYGALGMGNILSQEDWEKVWASLIIISYKSNIEGEIAAKAHKKDIEEINRKLDYIIEKINSKNFLESVDK